MQESFLASIVRRLRFPYKALTQALQVFGMALSLICTLFLGQSIWFTYLIYLGATLMISTTLYLSFYIAKAGYKSTGIILGTIITIFGTLLIVLTYSLSNALIRY